MSAARQYAIIGNISVDALNGLDEEVTMVGFTEYDSGSWDVTSQ